MIITAYNPRMIGLGTVAPAALTITRWGVMGWQFVTQPQAVATYRWVGAMTVALVQLAFWSAVWVVAKAQQWAASEVSAALPSAAPEVDPFCPTVNPLPVVQPAAKPTLAELRKRCIDHNKALPQGDTRRIARAARLNKADAIAALRMAA
jgi:hypothetical protein